MSVTAARGFRAAGVAAGLKSAGGLDVALVVNDGPISAAAGVVTSNRVKAAPVLWTEQVLRAGSLRAVVLNSGGANACTGTAGFQDTHRTAEHVAGLLGVGAGDVAVCSTGLIGERLRMDLLLNGVDAAHASLGPSGAAAAEAILTTDSRSKERHVRVDDRDDLRVGDRADDRDGGWSVGGMAKGAGMLAPGLATMLAVLTTDAVVEPATLRDVLLRATRETFDRVDSDGCMSTNDTVLLLASGASGVRPGVPAVLEAVRGVCAALAADLVSDAEGASHEIAVEVTGAVSEDDAVQVGRAVARSNLVKCAVFGRDPNWGRVLAAVGTTGADFDPLRVDVSINGVAVCRDSAVGEPRELVDMSDRTVRVQVDLKAGPESATVWTNDLTHAYVHENSAYST